MYYSFISGTQINHHSFIHLFIHVITFIEPLLLSGIVGTELDKAAVLKGLIIEYRREHLHTLLYLALNC